MQSLNKAPLTPACHEPGTTDSRHAPLCSQASLFEVPCCREERSKLCLCLGRGSPITVEESPLQSPGGASWKREARSLRLQGGCEKHPGPMKGIQTVPWLQDSCKHSPSWPSCCLRFLQNWGWQATWENGFGFHLTVTRIPRAPGRTAKEKGMRVQGVPGPLSTRVLCEHPVQMVGAGPGNPHIQISDGTVGWHFSQGLLQVPMFPV